MFFVDNLFGIFGALVNRALEKKLILYVTCQLKSRNH